MLIIKIRAISGTHKAPADGIKTHKFTHVVARKKLD